MPRHYKVNLFNSLVFIACGLFGFISHYLELGDYQQTTLIPFILGILLLVMTPSLKNGSPVIKKGVMWLTFFFGTVVLVMLIQDMGGDKTSARKMILLTIISISCFGSFAVYLNHWINERKNGSAAS